MRDIRESDWKRLRQLQPVALDRFCRDTLARVQQLSSEPSLSAHDRYLNVYRLMEDRDRTIARIFNDVRRSNALLRLASMRTSGLITDEEFAGFSEELKQAVTRFQEF